MRVATPELGFLKAMGLWDRSLTGPFGRIQFTVDNLKGDRLKRDGGCGVAIVCAGSIDEPAGK